MTRVCVCVYQRFEGVGSPDCRGLASPESDGVDLQAGDSGEAEVSPHSVHPLADWMTPIHVMKGYLLYSKFTT